MYKCFYVYRYVQKNTYLMCNILCDISVLYNNFLICIKKTLIYLKITYINIRTYIIPLKNSKSYYFIILLKNVFVEFQ